MKKIITLVFIVLLSASAFRTKAESGPKDSIKDVGFDVEFILKSVKFTGNTDQFAAGYASSLDKLIDLMRKKNQIKIKISSYIDKSIFAVKTNEFLTQKRADAVKKYLVTKGIATDRILAVGMNASKPVDSLAKVSDKNNRVTASFKKQNTEVGYSKPALVENVKFGSTSDSLFSSSYPAFDRLIKYLTTYSQIRIKIYGHALTPNTEDYNLKLSQNRANTVKKYFISQKISGDRIETEGLGDNYPVGIEEAPEAAEYNNRIEISFKKGRTQDELSKGQTLKGVSFVDNSDEITPASFAALDKFVVILTQKAESKIAIQVMPNAENGESLATRRALAVKKYLVSKKIAESRIETSAGSTIDPAAGIEVKFK